MRKHREPKCKRRKGERGSLGLLIALYIATLNVAFGGAGAGVPDTQRVTVAAGAPDRTASDTGAALARPLPQLARPHPKSTLDDRVHLLSEALNLDPSQQSQLRMALLSQREQVTRLWNDPSMPAAYRISATRNITEKTADRIRSFLTEDQRKKFNPPRQAHEPDPNASVRSVEDWMKPPTTK